MSFLRNIVNKFKRDGPKPKTPLDPAHERIKDYPDGPPKSHSEHIDHIGVQPGSKV